MQGRARASPSAFPPPSAGIYGDLPHRAAPAARPGAAPCWEDWGSEASSKNNLGERVVVVVGTQTRMRSCKVEQALPRAPRLPRARLTVLLVEGVVAQAQRGPALPALEAAAVEEASLGAGSLQEVDAAAAEVASVTALPAGRRLRGERTGWGGTGVPAPTTQPRGPLQRWVWVPGTGLLAPARERQALAPENQLGQETGREEPAARRRSLAQRRSRPLARPHQLPVPPKRPPAQRWTPPTPG